MAEPQKQLQSEQPKFTPRRLTISVPVKATVYTEQGIEELRGRLEELEEGKARISLGHLLAAGTELSILVEFSDRKGREIRFRYIGKVASAANDPWYGVDVDFEEGVGISGQHAREILAELFPETGSKSFS